MRTANPALTDKTFNRFSIPSKNSMTIQGTVNKTFILVIITSIVAIFSWNALLLYPAYILVGLFGGTIIAFIIALITIFNPRLAPFTAWLYALFEGMALGIISVLFERAFPGIIFHAILLTFGTLIGLLLAYTSGLIKATENFKLGVIAATLGIVLVYIIDLLLLFAGLSIPFIHESGWIGIGFSVFVVTIAALNLVLDFDFIEHGTNTRAPKYMEWYAAFGLLVTLVWLYLEILRLLGKLRKR
jgi:uncharacterized YccA/Bax inhibitor family protein